MTPGPGPGHTIDQAQPIGGELLAEISRTMVRLYKECYGKGPEKARTYASDNLLVCVLEGGFTRGERTLRNHGREDAVQVQREAFQDVLRRRVVETVEALVDRKVVTFISGVDTHSETSAELFLLEPAPSDVADETEALALAGWGEQVRRQARTLREEQAELREQQAGLRQRSETSRESRRPRDAG
jgi:uncharacterized protein YbcI